MLPADFDILRTMCVFFGRNGTMNLLNVLIKISSMTMLSRVLGFVRDVIIARIFGASVATDAFFVAFKLPNLLRRIFAEGAFSQAFVPILAEYKTQKGENQAIDFAQRIAGMLSFVLFWVTLAGVLGAPWIIYISAPGFAQDADKFALSVSLLRITFPYILLISLSSFVGSLLNSYHKFSISAFSPTLLNISFIVFALFFAPYFNEPVMALAWAVVVGGIAQLAFQLPFLKPLGFLKWPKLRFNDPGVRRVLKQMIPAILGVSIAQISLIINTIFASFLENGSVSWMYYADRLMELPTGVLGVALGTMLLPTLSSRVSSQESLSPLLSWGIRLCSLLAIPAAAALAMLAYPMLSTLFGYDQFSIRDTLMTQKALMAYCVGLPALILIKVLAPAFYAHQNVKTPVKIAILTLLVTQIFNLLLIGRFQHAGLALAISLGACLNASLLYILLRRKNIYVPERQNAKFQLRVIASTLVMSVLLWIIQQNVPFNWNAGALWRIGQLSALIGIGAVVYFISLFLMGFRFHQIKRSE